MGEVVHHMMAAAVFSAALPCFFARCSARLHDWPGRSSGGGGGGSSLIGMPAYQSCRDVAEYVQVARRHQLVMLVAVVLLHDTL